MKRDTSKMLKALLHSAPVVGAMLLGSPIQASIIGSSTANLDGSFTYSFKIDNSGGTFDVAAWSVEFGFPHPDWNQADVPSGGEVTVPNLQWFASEGTPVTGLSAQDFLSLIEDGDVRIGQSLEGFSFTSRFQPGTVTFHEFSASGEEVSGTTIGPVIGVPESGRGIEPLALGALAAFGLVVRKSRRSTNG